jgi:hypothetical protein
MSDRSEDVGACGRRFRLHQRLGAVGPDPWIEDDEGERCFEVDEMALGRLEALILRDLHGREVAKLQHSDLREGDATEIKSEGICGDRSPDSRSVATSLCDRRAGWRRSGDPWSRWTARVRDPSWRECRRDRFEEVAETSALFTEPSGICDGPEHCPSPETCVRIVGSPRGLDALDAQLFIGRYPRSV